MLENLKSNHSLIITLEDGELDGGFGEKITRFYGDSTMKVLNYVFHSKNSQTELPWKSLKRDID